MSWLAWVGCIVATIVGLYWLAWWNTKRITALNVVHAVLTYRTLSAGQAGGVDGQVANICNRLRLDISLLGPSFPANDDRQKGAGPEVVYAFRSLAMRELGIPSADGELPRWYVLRNPFSASLAKAELQAVRRRVEQRHQVRLTELDQ